MYLSVKDIAKVDLQLVVDGSCRLPAVVHDLDHTVVLKNLLQAIDQSCLDGAVRRDHVKDEADRSSIHLHCKQKMDVIVTSRVCLNLKQSFQDDVLGIEAKYMLQLGYRFDARAAFERCQYLYQTNLAFLGQVAFTAYSYLVT